MAGNSGEPGRTVTSKLAAILVAFANGRDFTLSELAMHTNLAISTVHRLLTDLVRTSLLERPDGITYRPGPALHEMLPYVTAATHPAGACALRRRGSRDVAARDRPLRHRRRPGGRVHREGAPAGAGHAVPQRRPAAAARDGHGQGAAGLRTAVAHPAPARQRSPPLHRPDAHLPDRARARPAEGPHARLRGHRRRARTRRHRRGRARVRRAAGGPSPPSRWTSCTRAGTRSNSRYPRCWWPHAACAGRSPPPSGSIGRSDRGTTRAGRISCGCRPDRRVERRNSDRDVQGDAHAVEGGGHSGRRVPVGDHRCEPIQRARPGPVPSR